MPEYIKEETLIKGIIELRKARNLSQGKLAEMLGTNQVVISRIESGE